jgi:hypothetical protein
VGGSRFLDLEMEILVSVGGHWRIGGKVLTFPDVQINQQRTEFVALLGVGVDFGGETGGGTVLLQ